MAANWDYALMAHEASLHGGPEEYVDSIRQDAFGDGFENGTIFGTIITAGAVIVAAVGSFAWNKYTEYRERRKEEKIKAEESRVRLVMTLREKENEESDNSMSTE